MLMEDRSVPWWRKALHFALDGIRSGFGLFSRTPAKNETPEPARPARQQDNPKEESELIDHSPTLDSELETRAGIEAAASAPVAVPSTQAAPKVVPESAPVVEVETVPELATPAPAEIPHVTETAPVPEAHPPQIETEADNPEAAFASMSAAALEPEPIETIEEPHGPATHSPEEPGGAAQSAPDPTPEPVEENIADLPPEPVQPPAPEIPLTPASTESQPEPESQYETPVLPAVEPEVDTPEPPLQVTALATPEPKSETEPIKLAGESAEIETAQETRDKSQPDSIEPVALTETADPAPVDNPVPGIPASPVELKESVAIETPQDIVEQPALAEGDVEEIVEDESLNEAVRPAETVLTSEAELPAAEQDPEQEPPQAPPTMEMNEPIPEQTADQPIESGTVHAAEVVEEPVVPPGESSVETAPIPAVEPQPEPATALPDPPAHKPLIKLESRDNEADLSPFSVIVAQVYDGPLDLLLDLIRKQDIDIYDIPIARITAQFLAYVNQLKATDVDVAGEFIYTASLLIHIKSKMLLPRAPSGPDDEAEDPRRELVERLLEHERFKNAAQMLQQKQMLEAATWSNPGIHEFRDDVSAEPEIAADTVDLVRIFRDILERARNRPVINVQEDSVTVGQMIQFLARRLTMEDKPVALRRLLSHTRSERALIAMFLALLELVRMQAILLRQDRAFSEIFIKKNSGFENLMNEGLANARDDWQ
jgi:segregation and condensation protein A